VFSILASLALGVVPIDYYFTPASGSITIKSPQIPILKDPKLKAEVVFKGLKFPTSMAFLGPDDILVLEKNNGTVRRIVGGKTLPEPLLDVNVATKEERGMLGIAVAKHDHGPTYVFLYYTEAATKDGDDVSEGKQPLGNRLYRYELEQNKLVNPKLFLNLPVSHDALHNGGKVLIGPDKNVYVGVGDLEHPTEAENYESGLKPDGTGGILRITQDSVAVKSNPLGNADPVNLYYAYGIRNSFGMDFDPLTGKLWDTENGPGYGDEINLVEPGFNSGWARVQGIWQPIKHNYYPGNITLNPDNLVDFDGKGKYRLPEFTWYNNTGPTAIKFFDSNKLGKEYKDGIFVGDFHKGNLYHFDLNKKRTQLTLKGQLDDKVANNTKELQNIIFGQGFGAITDIQVGPDDGYLYVVSISYGAIYRIAPVNEH
jgi:glucose/arabinose dehydrogenase